MKIFSALLAFFAGYTPVTGEFPSQRPVTRNFDISFDLRPNKGWEKNYEASDLGRHRAHYDVIVIRIDQLKWTRNEVHIWYGRPIFNRCDPLTSYGDILLSEHWFR